MIDAHLSVLGFPNQAATACQLQAEGRDFSFQPADELEQVLRPNEQQCGEATTSSPLRGTQAEGPHVYI